MAGLRAVLEPWLNGEIEQIGSTAVSGLCAEPVIDIMAPITTLRDSTLAIEAFSEYSYLHWHCKPSELVRTHHLHLVPSVVACGRTVCLSETVFVLANNIGE
jgi:GrpB-like predicted nucleotidyltransferase (UPF0157 family)